MKKLKIYFTSDVHGYLFPTDYASNADKPMGLFKLAADYAIDGNTLVIDGGDSIQGSPFVSYALKKGCRPHILARAMNLAGYNYVTLGNHDLNHGLDELNAYLSDLDAVCLCANIRDKAGKLPIQEYAIHTLENGLRVGVTGVCTHYVTIWEQPETIAQLIVEEPVPAAKRAMEKMKGQADLFVCIYHGGFECDLNTGARLTESHENEAWQLCEEGGFDVVLTGHQHMPVDCIGIGSAVAVQPGYKAPHYALVEVELDGEDKMISSRLCPPSGAMIPGAEDFRALENEVQAWLDTPKGHLDTVLPAEDHLKMASEGCLLANFINAIQLENTGAQVAATSLGNEIAGMNRDVTIRDVVSAYIYSNTLVVKEMTGAELKAYAERCAEYFDVRNGELIISDTFIKPKVEHYNYDYFYGMDYVIDARKPIGSRVVSMKLDGTEIQPGQKVTVCMNNYRASGTGGYEMVKNARTLKEYQDDVSELIIRYISSHEQITVDKRRWLTVLH